MAGFFNPKETGRPVTIKDEGVSLTPDVSEIDFKGAGVTGAAVGPAVTETIPGGSAGAGDVVGPASSVDNAIARFDGTSGKIIQDYTSGAPTIGDTGVITGTSVTQSSGDNSTNIATTAYADAAGAGGGATTALDNLASVAINTSLISDTDVTDDLGSSAIKWNNLFVANIGATATRITKLWATDITVTNAIAGSITGNAGTVTTIAGLAPDTATTQASQPNITSLGTLTGLTMGGTLAMGANNITSTGSLGTTGSRLAKGWFVDLQVTNAIAGSITGNAGSATALETPRTINGVSFDGSANITVTAAAGTLTGTTLQSTVITSSLTTVGTVTSGTWSSNITSATVTNALTLAENASIALDPAGSADGRYTGLTFTGTGGATIVFGDLVYLDVTTSRWKLADASAISTAGDVDCAIAVTSSTDGAAITVLFWGIIRADAKFPTFTIGAPVYISETAGEAVETQPTTTDAVIRRVGTALTANEIRFNQSNTYITHT